MPEFTNDLIHETSPYLLQHAHNPVDWQPWTDEALALAEKESKLIVVSIGYAACHWCHVMEHESFEDHEVAEYMNKHYISVKVDREERPDIDQVYMDAAHLITGRGGWPLNVITLPDGRPIYAGTYFSKQQWLKVLKGVYDFYKKTPEKALEQAMQIAAGVNKMGYMPENTQQGFKRSVLMEAVADWKASIDHKEGGRAGQMKFPMPKAYLTLLNYGVEFSDQQAIDLVKLTLDKMASGGIYDQLGGGFSRYSVDPIWHVPHFEKMLYDNAQLIELYSEAYKLTKDPFYKQVVVETIGFCQRELGAPENAFYSSLDADSEGEEGKFYVWQSQEIIDHLGDQANLFMDFFGVTTEGNWEKGNNALKMSMPIEEITQKYGLTVEQLGSELINAKQKLFSAREKRIRPALDDKVLTSWNALMITGLARAYEAIGDPAYRQAAEQTGDFIWQHMWNGNMLLRSRKNNKSTITGFVDDYAFTIAGFIDVYQLNFDLTWIERAETLLRACLELYFNDQSGFFEFKSKAEPTLFVTKSVIEDNVIPAGNSEMAINLFRLGHLLDNTEYLSLADNMLMKMSDHISQHAAFYYNWADLYRIKVGTPTEVVVLGSDFDKKRQQLMSEFLPSVIILGGPEENGLPLLKGKSIEGKTMIYVCIDKTCQLPTESTDDALNQLRQE